MIDLIPAIDLIEGRVMRLKQGDFSRAEAMPRSINDLLQELEDLGLRKLHLVNLSAAKAGSLMDLELIQAICARGFEVDYGGGIRSKSDVEQLLEIGVKEVNIGSMILRNPTSFANILSEYPHSIIASVDVRDESLAIEAWRETSQVKLWEVLDHWVEKGLKKVCITDIAQDGMMQGPALKLYEKVLQKYPNLKLTASGGVRHRADVEALESIGCSALVVGRAWLTGAVKLSDLC